MLARAKNNAYALLRLRPRSEAELIARLKTKGHDSGVVGAIVEELKKKGLVDDAKFAQFWINSRMHLKPVGDYILKRELKTKGVSSATVEAALRSRGAEYDEYGAAKNIAMERFKRLGRIDRRKAAKRVYDFLLRRGFKYDCVRRVIEELMNLSYDD